MARCLATATFVTETASGWQEVTLPSAVAISANTTYVASYHSTPGYYVASTNYFTTAVTNGPLTALADGTDGPNGLYRYGTTGFPTQSYNKSNYWVDVVFSTSPAAPDTTPPTVQSTTPANASAGALVGTTVSARFNEPLASSTVTNASVLLRDSGGVLVPATVSWDAATASAILRPNSALAYSTTYAATVKGGTGGVTDVAGNPLATDYSWSFTTQALPPPPPADGPGGPILVIGYSGNPFTRYYAEILRAEGLNAFKALDVSAVDATVLAQYDTAILGEMPLTTSQATMLSDWVNGGGNLIAMRPAPQLATLLGLTASGSTLAEGYLAVDTSRAPGSASSAARSSSTAPPTATRSRPSRQPPPRSRHSTRTPPPPRRTPPSFSAPSAPPAARRLRSRSTSRGRSSTHARATPRGPATSATGRARSARTTCSTATRAATRRPTG